MTDFSRIYYFGDSLTDSGNGFELLQNVLRPLAIIEILANLGRLPRLDELAQINAQAGVLAETWAREAFPQIGPTGAVTNALTHARYAEILGGHEVANYAVAAAQALNDDLIEQVIGLEAQIAAFSRDAAGSVPANAAGFILIGGNDLAEILDDLDLGQASPQDLLQAAQPVVDGVLARIEDAARVLDTTGVETVFLASQPPAGFYQGFSDLPAPFLDALDTLLGQVNDRIDQLISTLQGDGIDAQLVDLFAITTALLEDPEGFGIVAPLEDVLIEGSSFDSDQILAWDEIHPAEAAQQLWGAYSEFVMSGGATYLMDDSSSDVSPTEFGDLVLALGGNDKVLGGRGNDISIGGTGNDTLLGGAGNDLLMGGSDDDVLRGSAGRDILAGGDGDDMSFGGHAVDVLIDGRGNDTCFGGVGDDIFIFIESSLIGGGPADSNAFNGGRGNDTLYLVLDEATFAAFDSETPEDTLVALGIETKTMENFVAVDGRGGIAEAFGGFDWFEKADFWGAFSVPTSLGDDLVA